MALVIADRIQETTTTTGTGDYALAGAKDGFVSFAGVGNGNTTYYACSDGTDFEIGLGTYSSLSNGFITRTTILTSSNSNAAVNWSAGEKDIFVTLPADKAVIEDGSNNITIGNNITVGGTVDGRDIATDGVKLDGIEASATADQTDAEIKTAYENNSDTNAFTDALLTKLNGVDTSANNYVHPNHSGEVTSTADGATVIADNVVDEANLKVSNTPTNGYFLSAQSGNTGGLTWADAGHYTDADVDTHLNTSGAQTNEVLSWNGSDYNWTTVGANQALDTTSSPTFSTLTVTNTVTADTFNATSDATLKTNIAPIKIAKVALKVF